jgi:5-methylcytosine-specific restriction endonuclease McrA
MTYIPKDMREQVIHRANNQCEYCLVHQYDSLYAHEIDHIIAKTSK